MINVDISNVWTCVTLPELLGSEKEIFDAHNLLRNNQPDGPDLLGWGSAGQYQRPSDPWHPPPL